MTDEFVFYTYIKIIGTNSFYVLIPKNIIDISGWNKGDFLEIRAVKKVPPPNVVVDVKDE